MYSVDDKKWWNTFLSLFDPVLDVATASETADPLIATDVK